MTDAQLDCALDLMRRLPPQHIEENLAGLIDLVSRCHSLHTFPAELTHRCTLCEDGRLLTDGWES